ncbi:MAG: DUF6678 family protein [Halopseudomonas sp.]
MEVNLGSHHQVMELIEGQRLIGAMNNTRWNALFNDLNNVEEMLSYKVTYIDGSCWPEADSGHSETSEIEQIWGNFIAMEFLDIRTKIEKPRGALVSPETVDITVQVTNLCAINKAKISLTEHGVRVWGYFRHDQTPVLHEYT